MSGFVDLFRYELKYLVSPSLIPHVREYLKAYCSPDPYNQSNGGYGIISLYLDTPQRQFVQEKKQNLARRQKLRIRSYAGNPAAGVHFEIKRRLQDFVHKTRASVPAEDWYSALLEPKRFEDYFAENKKGLNNLKLFQVEVQSKACSPCMLIYYEREAYVSDLDRYARVTFDQKLRYQAQSEWNLEGIDSQWQTLDAKKEWGYSYSPVVLELKCEERIPLWMLKLIKEFDLTRCGFSKYVNSYEIAMRGPLDLLDLIPQKEIHSDGRA